ncbi:MAG: hypothetical protein ACE5NN_07520 [Candidatus Bathyarchaeia archaeon]
MPSFHHKEEKAQKHRESRKERRRKIKALQEKGWTQDRTAGELGIEGQYRLLLKGMRRD